MVKLGIALLIVAILVIGGTWTYIYYTYGEGVTTETGESTPSWCGDRFDSCITSCESIPQEDARRSQCFCACYDALTDCQN